MADIDFPSNPTDGQTHTDGNLVEWTYRDANGWNRAPVNLNNNDPNIGSDSVGRNLYVGSNPEVLAGEDNTTVGIVSGRLVQNGKRNTLVGSYAGENTDQSSDNVLIGHKTGQALTGGNAHGNVAIGAQAQSAQSIANKTVVIGNNARLGSPSETGSIVIGADAVGLGTQTTVIGGPLNGATYLTGELHVSGQLIKATSARVEILSMILTPIPLASLGPIDATGQLHVVSDAAGGPVLVMSNGTNWVIAGTQTPVT